MRSSPTRRAALAGAAVPLPAAAAGMVPLDVPCDPTREPCRDRDAAFGGPAKAGR